MGAAIPFRVINCQWYRHVDRGENVNEDCETKQMQDTSTLVYSNIMILKHRNDTSASHVQPYTHFMAKVVSSRCQSHARNHA
jgi:hypothetical protein